MKLKWIPMSLIAASALCATNIVKAQSTSSSSAPTLVTGPTSPSIAPESNSLLLFAFAGGGCLAFFAIKRLITKRTLPS